MKVIPFPPFHCDGARELNKYNITIAVIATITKAFNDPNAQATPQNLWEGNPHSQTWLLWESFGELSKMLMSDPSSRDSDFIGPGAMGASGIFLKLPCGSAAQPGLRMTALLTVSPPWKKSVFRDTWPHQRERRQPPGSWRLIFRGRTWTDTPFFCLVWSCPFWWYWGFSPLKHS